MNAPELNRTEQNQPPQYLWHSGDYLKYYDEVTTAGRRSEGLKRVAGHVAASTEIPAQPSAAQAADRERAAENYRAYLEARRGTPAPGSISLDVLSASVVEKLYYICNPQE